MHNQSDLKTKLLSAENDIFYVEDDKIKVPKKMFINGKHYYRFCDFILVPNLIDKLSPQQVISANNIRSKYIERQAQFQTNQKVRGYFKEIVQKLKPKTILEFGPGSRPLFHKPIDHIEKIYLADFSHLVIEELARHQINCIHFPVDGRLTIPDKSIDLVIAVFVLQFDISANQIRELYRVLSDYGTFLTNIYKRTESSRKKLIKDFVAAGFNCYRIFDPSRLCEKHEYLLMHKGKSNDHVNTTVSNIITSNLG